MLLLLLLSLASPLQDDDLQPNRFLPPALGEVAPELGDIAWYHHRVRIDAPRIAGMRGDVVLVHTWGYYCGPCMKEGVPLVVDLVRANADAGLRALSLTCQVSDGKPFEHFVEVGAEMGMQHPLAMASAFGEVSPYLNMNVNKGLTWCFVIGRTGGVRWLGDPSIDTEEFLEAVRLALAEPRLAPLEEGYPSELAGAVSAYVEGRFADARNEAEKVRAKQQRKKATPEVEELLAKARGLIEVVDAYRTELARRLATSLEQRDASAFVATERALLAGFPGTEEAKRLKPLRKGLRGDKEFLRELDRWGAWRELELERPALFPVRVDRATKRYAKELGKYLKGASADGPGTEEARRLVAAFEEQREQ